MFKILGNYESSTGSAHYYSESRHHGEAGAEMAELSPGYSHGGYADPAAEEGAETSGSGSAEDGSGSEETDEEGAGGYDGGPLSILAAKKRRKQTVLKPIQPARGTPSPSTCPPSLSTRTRVTRPRRGVSRDSDQ